MTELPLGLTYDDVLLVPAPVAGALAPRGVDPARGSRRAIELAIPIVSANMDTVTTAPMAIAMAQLGGIGVLHRFLSIEEEAADARRVKRYLTHVVTEPYTIPPGATLAHARAEAARLDVTGFLVVDQRGVACSAS